MRSPAGLALRLQRASILGWATALVVLAFADGVLVGPMTDTFADLSGDLVAVFGADDVLGTSASWPSSTRSLSACSPILAVQGVRSEVSRGRA